MTFPEVSEKSITITLGGAEGDLTIAPTYAHVARGQVVSWSVAGDPSASILIVFDDPDGFGDLGAYTPKSTPAEKEEYLERAKQQPAVEVRSRAGGAHALALEAGIYHYRIAVHSGTTLSADMYCPTVVVR
jgi:class 3 adenylate cyclase